MQAAKVRRLTEWAGLQMRQWDFEAYDKIWIVVELRTNIELLNEGRKQRHCVFAHVPQCVGGRSAIFSMRCYQKVVARYTDLGHAIWDRSCELTRLTIEVTETRAVVQARGHLNRQPTDEELKVLRRWAGDKALQMGM